MSSKDQLPPAQEQLFEGDSLDAELFWHKYSRLILTSAGVLIVVVLGVVFWVLNVQQSHRDAVAALASATDIAGWQGVIDRYPGTSPAADAYFLLAQAKRTDGDIEGSTKAYEDFLAAFPDHALAGGAKLGLAENLEVQGKVSEALTALQELQSQNTVSYAVPYAALLEGRILMQQGKMVEARKAFQTLLRGYPSSPASSLAGNLLREIDTVLPPEPAAQASVPPPQPQ